VLSDPSGIGNASNIMPLRTNTPAPPVAARSIFVVHDLRTLRIDPVASGIDVIVLLRSE
jgi:hypothetical protein